MAFCHFHGIAVNNSGLIMILPLFLLDFLQGCIENSIPAMDLLKHSRPYLSIKYYPLCAYFLILPLNFTLLHAPLKFPL